MRDLKLTDQYLRKGVDCRAIQAEAQLLDKEEDIILLFFNITNDANNETASQLQKPTVFGLHDI